MSNIAESEEGKLCLRYNTVRIYFTECIKKKKHNSRSIEGSELIIVATRQRPNGLHTFSATVRLSGLLHLQENKVQVNFLHVSRCEPDQKRGRLKNSQIK